VVVDGNLTDGSMVEVVKTATEAKTVAIRELDIRSRFSGDLATGTLTDSVAVACTKKGTPIQYAGTFTLIGELIGKCVREGVKTAITKQENIWPDRPLINRLADRCLPLEAIIPQVSEGKVIGKSPDYEALEKQFEVILSDKKMMLLVIAALRLDEDLAKGLIPKKTIEIIDQKSLESMVKEILKGPSPRDPSMCIFSKENPQDAGQIGPYSKCVLTAIFNQAQKRLES
jgi:hypothetical protein